MTRRRRGLIAWLMLLGVVLGALPAAIVFARPGVVRTTSGQTYDGEIDDKDPDVVVVSVRGIPTRINRSQVASIDYPAGDADKEFAERIAKLPPNDIPGRLALAREAFDQKKYSLARQAAESARMIDPNNTDAIAMLDTIQSQMRMERAKQQPPPSPAGHSAGPATTEAATEPSNEKLLKPADINTIRQAELRGTDSGVRIRFDRDVKKRFMAYSAMSPADFNSLTVNDQVQYVLARGTPEMKRDVQVLSDPPALFQYRRQIQPFVLANCATAGCHTSINPSAGFQLITPGESDAATYTNFYILQTFTKAVKMSGATVFGKGDLRMIDRQQPDRSMLLQYALPGAIAEYDHPDVPGYKPALRGFNDPRYTQIDNWIGQTLRPEDPNYGIDFAVSGSTTSATTQASTQPVPATQPAQPATAPRNTRPATRPAPPPPRPATPRVGTVPAR